VGERKSSDTHEIFGLVIESARDFAIFTTDPGGTVTSWNIGAERLFGYSEAEALGRDGDALTFTPEDRANGVAADERRRAVAEGRAEDERWHLRKGNSRFWASGLMMPLRPPAEGFCKITRDRTRQHEAEEKLRVQEERFRLLALAIPQLVFRCREDGTRTWGSPQWIEFAGMSLEDSLGFGWLEAIHPDDREATREAWRHAPATGEYYCEHRVRRARDGEYRWHQTRARPVRPDDWVGTMTDIHDLRGLQDRQQVLMAELQHRTRNLLAVVQAIANQTRRSSTDLDSFVAEFGSRLRALGRVQSLLSRAEQEDIDLRTLIEAELGAHGDGALEPGKVTVEGEKVALPPGSAQALGLAIHELATNAMKYGALHQPTGRLRVRWTVEALPAADSRPGDGGRRVRLEWRESGVPMPAGSPPRRGYGRELIERALPYQLRARTELVFGPDGVSCVILAPIRAEEVAHG
jgi:PAS domain S-box-containing protein